MYHYFNIHKFYVLPTQCIYVFCVDLRTNSDYFPIQHKLVGFCNRDGECLLRGTDWVLYTRWVSSTSTKAMIWIGCLVAGLSPRRPGSTTDQLMWDLWWTKWQWNRFSMSTSSFPCQHHSTIAPYSFILLPPTLYNVFLPVLQFSSVSIIPSLLHTHSFIYHPRCIMFFLPVL